MKRKKKSQQSLTESVITTASQLAKERGLDPDILEKEALEYRFGAMVSGQCNVDVIRYDKWVGEQIRSSGADIVKPLTRKSLSETSNKGVLNGNITNLTHHVLTHEADRDWRNILLAQSQDDLETKKIKLEIKQLTEKIVKKKGKIETARNRLHHLYDAALGDLEIETPNTEENQDENDD